LEEFKEADLTAAEVLLPTILPPDCNFAPPIGPHTGSTLDRLARTWRIGSSKILVVGVESGGSSSSSSSNGGGNGGNSTTTVRKASSPVPPPPSSSSKDDVVTIIPKGGS